MCSWGSTMTEPTTAEIREAATGDYAYQLVPWYVLLDRLEAAEKWRSESRAGVFVDDAKGQIAKLKRELETAKQEREELDERRDELLVVIADKDIEIAAYKATIKEQK